MPHTIAEYSYDGLGRRYRKVVTDSGQASVGGRNRTEYFYYDSQWRVLEVRNDQDLATRQFVWGTQYTDELLLMDVDTDGDGECTDFDFPGTYGYARYRYFQDAHYNVVAIWDEHAGAALDRNEHFAGQIRERYEYDPYGTCRIFQGWDEAAACESLNVTGQSQVPGGNPIRYGGYYFDDETGLYQVRNRMYSPGLQRFLQRDPAGYIDGMSLYAYVRGNPIGFLDPAGLVSWLTTLSYLGQGYKESLFSGQQASSIAGTIDSATAQLTNGHGTDLGVQAGHEAEYAQGQVIGWWGGNTMTIAATAWTGTTAIQGGIEALGRAGIGNLVLSSGEVISGGGAILSAAEAGAIAADATVAGWGLANLMQAGGRYPGTPPGEPAGGSPGGPGNPPKTDCSGKQGSAEPTPSAGEAPPSAPKGKSGLKGSAARKNLEGYKDSLKSKLQGRQRDAFKEMIEDRKVGEQYLDKNTLDEIFQDVKDNVKPS